MANYSMKDLQRIINKTPQSIRQVLKNNDSIKLLLEEHKVETPNKKVFYDDAILNALLEYYGISKKENAVEDAVGVGSDNIETAEKPNTNPPPSNDIDKDTAALQSEIEELKKQLEGQKKDISDLEKQLHDKEAERLHFIGENAKLVNLLAAERQERDKLLLLLPPANAPKTTIWSRFKRLFVREKEAAKDE